MAEDCVFSKTLDKTMHEFQVRSHIFPMNTLVHLLSLVLNTGLSDNKVNVA